MPEPDDPAIAAEPKPDEPEAKIDDAADEPHDGGPLGAGLPWKVQRAEIAEEPGNHGRFAFGCSVAIAVLLAAFWVLRAVIMK